MEYFVPAWHGQLTDWAKSVPRIEIYDAVVNMQLLRSSGRKVGLVLTDYQPQFLSKLNQVGFYPDDIFSVFDYLQGINSNECQVFNYLDLNWPDDVRFDFTPFRILAASQNRLYASIVFDFNGRVLNVNYFDENKQVTKKLVFDTRGFVSAVEEGDVVSYYDQMGHWRFKHNTKTDQVVINRLFHFCQKSEYDHLNDLVTEVIVDKFLPRVENSDHLIVTLDDQARVPNEIFLPYSTIFTLNQSNPFTGDLKIVNNHALVVDNRQSLEKIDSSVPFIVIPSFLVDFKLGHSQRLSEQIIGIMIEHMSYDDLKNILFALYPRLLLQAKTEQICFLYYDADKENMINQVLDDLKKAHPNEFDLNRPKKSKIENDLGNGSKLPNLIIKSKRLSSIAEAMKFLDKARLLINWNVTDSFIQTAAVSVGIPQLQNFKTLQLINHRNGLICKTPEDVAKGVDYYLGNLSNWNQALVFDVQLMNAYSADNLLKQWQSVLNDKEEI